MAQDEQQRLLSQEDYEYSIPLNTESHLFNEYAPGGSDALSFSYYAAGIVKFISNAQAPLCCGIYGQWGSGKTFLAEKIKTEFKLLPKSDVSEPRWLGNWFRLSELCYMSNNQSLKQYWERLTSFLYVSLCLKFIFSLFWALFTSYVLQTILYMYGCMIYDYTFFKFCCCCQPTRFALSSQVIVVDYNAWEFNRSDELWIGIIRNIYIEVERVFEATPPQSGYFLDLKTYWRVIKARRLLFDKYGRALVEFVMLVFIAPLILLVIYRNNISDSLNSNTANSIFAKAGAYLVIISIFLTSSFWVFITNRFSATSRGEAIFLEMSQGIRHQESFMKEVQYELQELFDFLASDVVRSSTSESLKLLIFVDDLDRCLGDDRIIKVLEAIQLLLNIPSSPVFLFLLVDSNIIVKSIELSLNKTLKSTGSSPSKPSGESRMREFHIRGSEYLMKMQQMTFCIPKPRPVELRDFVRAAVDGMSSSEENRRCKIKLMLERISSQSFDRDNLKVVLPNDINCASYSTPIFMVDFIDILRFFVDREKKWSDVARHTLNYFGNSELPYIRDLVDNISLQPTRPILEHEVGVLTYFAITNFQSILDPRSTAVNYDVDESSFSQASVIELCQQCSTLSPINKVDFDAIARIPLNQHVDSAWVRKDLESAKNKVAVFAETLTTQSVPLYNKVVELGSLCNSMYYSASQWVSLCEWLDGIQFTLFNLFGAFFKGIPPKLSEHWMDQIKRVAANLPRDQLPVAWRATNLGPARNIVSNQSLTSFSKYMKAAADEAVEITRKFVNLRNRSMLASFLTPFDQRDEDNFFASMKVYFSCLSYAVHQSYDGLSSICQDVILLLVRNGESNKLKDRLIFLTTQLISLLPAKKGLWYVDSMRHFILPESICRTVISLTNRIDPNPRKIKRILNALQLAVEIASVRPMSKSSMFYVTQHKKWPSFIAKLAVWVVLCDCFPLRMCMLLKVLTDGENIRFHNTLAPVGLENSLNDRFDGVDIENMALFDFCKKYGILRARQPEQNLTAQQNAASKYVEHMCVSDWDYIAFDTYIANLLAPDVFITCSDILGPKCDVGAERDLNFSLLSYSFNLNPHALFE